MAKAKRFKIDAKTGSSRPAGLKSAIGEKLVKAKSKVKKFKFMGTAPTKEQIAKGHNYSANVAAKVIDKQKKKRKKALKDAGKY